MTEQAFIEKFDRGELDCEYAEYLCDHWDAGSKHKMLALWDNLGAYEDFKDHMTEPTPSTLLQDTFFGGSNPLDSFPTIWSTSK